MDEAWKDIDGYDGIFQISSLGRVARNTPTTTGKISTIPHIMSQWINWNRYHLITLCYKNKKKHFTVHSLVLKAFVGPRPDGMEAAHLDNNRSNNRSDNLIWCTRKENHSHKKIHGTQQHGAANGHARFTNEQVLKMRSLYEQSGWTQSEIARKYDARQGTIHQILKRKTWKHI